MGVEEDVVPTRPINVTAGTSPMFGWLDKIEKQFDKVSTVVGHGMRGTVGFRRCGSSSR